MGPIALFDKSFLQSLNLDESVWFDHFFYPVITPIFYVETLADLEKAVRQGRTPEQEVSFIADKTPEAQGGPCEYHVTLCIADLMGHKIPMNGRIPVSGGKLVRTDEGTIGAVYDESPAAKAFSRWQNRNFLEVERLFAKVWRKALTNLDLLAIASAMRNMGIDEKSCKSLETAKSMTEALISSGRPIDLLKMLSIFYGISPEKEKKIYKLWEAKGFQPLKVYAPYAAHLLSVEIFFQIALGSNLISSRVSNRTDIAYLFYIPFCMVFVSSDRLHKRCAPIFMRPNQEFVWGEDLKQDLKRLNEHYLKLPEMERETGLIGFASRPPQEGNFLVSQLWDHHLPSWRVRKSVPMPMKPEAEKNLVDRLKREADSRPLRPEEVAPDSTEAEFLTIKRKVRQKKGSWWQVPKDIKIK